MDSSTLCIGNLVKELVQWLARRAAQGDISAQVTFYSVAESVVDLFTAGAREEWEGFKRYAITKPWIPGMASRSKFLQKAVLETCVKLRQGERFPFPQAKETKAASMEVGQNALVDDLFASMMNKRMDARALEQSFGGYAQFGWLHPIMKEVVELPALRPDTVDAWHKVGMKIIKDSQGPEGWNHPAFGREPYKSLASQENPWARVKEAWRLRAKEWVRVGAWGDGPPFGGGMPATKWPPNKVVGQKSKQ